MCAAKRETEIGVLVPCGIKAEDVYTHSYTNTNARGRKEAAQVRNPDNLYKKRSNG